MRKLFLGFPNLHPFIIIVLNTCDFSRPLDDGSICLWDIGANASRKGGIVARSNAGVLAVDGDPKDLKARSKMISTGVTECISVDSVLKRAYVAVQSGMWYLFLSDSML